MLQAVALVPYLHAKKHVCRTCSRPQHLPQWEHSVRSEDEAAYFLKEAEVCTGEKRSVRKAESSE